MSRGDFDEMHALVDPHITARITNASGGYDVVEGIEPFLARIPDVTTMADSFTAAVTQAVALSGDHVLAMVEIVAERKGRSLNNFAAFVVGFNARRINDYVMVEALPAYSDEFWS